MAAETSEQKPSPKPTPGGSSSDATAQDSSAQDSSAQDSSAQDGSTQENPTQQSESQQSESQDKQGEQKKGNSGGGSTNERTAESEEQHQRDLESERAEQQAKPDEKPHGKKEEKEAREIKRKAGTWATVAAIALAVVGFVCFDLAHAVTGDHPQPEQVLAILGVADLVVAGLLLVFHKNWSRTMVLAAVPINLFLIIVSLTVIKNPLKYLALALCVVVAILMFRPPVLEEYDAPKE